MKKETKKNWESFLHGVLGFFAAFGFLGLLLHYRERWQLPPENDRYPVRWVLSQDGARAEAISDRESDIYERAVGDEYWSAVRVMDTLNDSREYWIGYTIGQAVQFCGALFIGAKYL